MEEICVFSCDDGSSQYYGMLTVLGLRIRIYSELRALLQVMAVRQVAVLIEYAALMQYGEDLLTSLHQSENRVALLCRDGDMPLPQLESCGVQMVTTEQGAEQFVQDCRMLYEVSEPETHHIPYGLPSVSPDFGELNRYAGVSAARNNLLSQIQKYAPYPVPLLFTGECGVGKTFLAELTASVYRLQKSIAASRSGTLPPDMPFVVCPIVSYSAATVESCLFGHVKGAYTGASSDYEGKIAAAGKGTLFLDEVGDIPPEVQVKMLQFLQQGTFSPMGSNEVKTSSARIISATNRNLETMLEDGSMRKDFLDRIAGKVIRVPSLNERLEDVPVLALHFLEEANREWGSEKKLADGAMYRLLELNWKDGNTRVLQNLIKRMIIESEGELLTAGLVDQCYRNWY